MGRKLMHRRFWWQSQKERDHMEQKGERVILKINPIEIGGVLRMGLVWLRMGTNGGLL
jgi:hypothetical protein